MFSRSSTRCESSSARSATGRRRCCAAWRSRSDGRRTRISRIPRLRRLFIVTNPPFQRFLDAHREDVWRFLVAAVGRDAADDCFQETFMAAMRAYPKTRIENPRAWVLTIAHRKTLDHHRARGRRAVPVGAVPDAPAPPAADPHGDGGWERVSDP